jgi:hypothetical protein
MAVPGGAPDAHAKELIFDRSEPVVGGVQLTEPSGLSLVGKLWLPRLPQQRSQQYRRS